MNGAAPQQQRPKAKILVVDDNEVGRYAKVRTLVHAGYSVLEARDGQAALRCVAEEHPDLLLLDVRLPDISGLEVCRRIKADPQTATIPVLQMSASLRDDQAKMAGFEYGADGYVTEPVEPYLLVATIEAFLRMRRAEQAVNERALEWQATFNAIADGVALVSTAGVIVRSNRALAALVDRPTEALSGAALDELLPPAPGDAPLWANLVSGQRQHAERCVGGRTFSLAVDPVCDAQAKLTGGVCTIRDITESRLMEERLRHTQKLESIGLLAGGVAHDFNNLLTGILGNASLGLEMTDDPAATGRAFRDITRASESAANLTRQLLAYAGKGKFVVKPLDLSQIVTGMLPLAKASFPRKIELVQRLAGDLPATEADQTQIEQIVMNLLINAAEAIGEDAGTVTVTTRALHFSKDQRPRYISDRELSGHFVMLEVRDTGVGMDEQTVRQIFDPFFTTKFMGRGLGLSAVLGIVRSHKGAIRVTSTPGEGAAFELLFPAAAVAVHSEAERPALAEEDRDRRGEFVLVVDDEAIVREFFGSALERRGYRVCIAENGAEALRIFARDPHRFSYVLLDLVMPVMSGKEVLPLLLEIRPEIKVVVTSGQVEEEVRRELTGLPVAAFLQKPCTAQNLAEKLSSLSGTGSLAVH